MDVPHAFLCKSREKQAASGVRLPWAEALAMLLSPLLCKMGVIISSISRIVSRIK